MSIHKYLLDEHVNPRLKEAVYRQNLEIIVWCIGDPGAPPRSTLDPDILLWCEAKGFTLVTNYRTSMPLHLQGHFAAGRRMPGIFILNNSLATDETAEQLSVIWEVTEPDEYADLITFLPLP